MMTEDRDDYLTRGQFRKCSRTNMSQEKANNILLEDLLEKEEEVSFYKTRLKELEEAFYYNLDLITERDLELSILEKQLATGNEQLQEVIHEKDELEDLIKTIDEKNNRKIQQLKTRISVKEEEIRDLQRENVTNVKTLKKLIDDVKQQQERKIQKMITKFEIQKRELIKGFMEKMEEKEKHYLREMDSLAGKLEQARREKEKLTKAEEENKSLKHYLEDIERLFLEKESNYLREIKQITKSHSTKASKEVQCTFQSQGVEKKIQSQPDTTTAFAQTNWNSLDPEDYIQKIKFLQEQNEVLKHIVKDLKKNRDVAQNPGRPPGCECPAIRTEVEQVNKKFENEINNLKKILEEEQKQRSEEDAVIQSLETSVMCLKEKLLSGLQEKLNDFAGEDLCAYTYNREIQNEIKVNLLEQKLSEKIDSFMTAAEDERKKIHEKLEQLKAECVDKLERYLKPRAEPESENLVEKIRWEIQKLESKMKNEMRNIVGSNGENKRDKAVELYFGKAAAPPRRQEPHAGREPCHPTDSRALYNRNDFCQEKYISFLKCPREECNQNQIGKRLEEQKGFRKPTNNLKVGR